MGSRHTRCHHNALCHVRRFPKRQYGQGRERQSSETFRPLIPCHHHHYQEPQHGGRVAHGVRCGAAAALLPAAGRYRQSALRLRDGRSLRCPCGSQSANGTELPCRRHLRSRGSPPGSGAQQMWKGCGWALDQPATLPHRTIIICPRPTEYIN